MEAPARCAQPAGFFIYPEKPGGKVGLLCFSETSCTTLIFEYELEKDRKSEFWTKTEVILILPKKLPKVLTEEEQAALLYPNPRWVTGERNLALLKLMLNTGLGLSEAMELK